MVNLAQSPPADVLAQWAILAAETTDPVPHGRYAAVLVLCVVLGLLSCVTVAMRFWLRAVIQRNVDLSDWLILFSLVGTLGILILAVVGSYVFHLDWHRYNVTNSQFVRILTLFFVGDFGYLLSSTVEKLSILLFYRRLASPQVAPKFNHAVSACMILSIGVWIGFSASLIATCSPVNAFWHRVNPAWREHHHFSCFNQGANILGASVIAIPMDLTLAILPITLFSKLKMDTTRKAALGALFATCFLPTVAVIVRTIYLYRAFYLDWDFTWVVRFNQPCPKYHHATANSKQIFQVWIWTGIECATGVVCSSAPALQALYNHYYVSASRLESTKAASTKQANPFTADGAAEMTNSARSTWPSTPSNRDTWGQGPNMTSCATRSTANRYSCTSSEGDAPIYGLEGMSSTKAIVVKTDIDVGFEEMLWESHGLHS